MRPPAVQVGRNRLDNRAVEIEAEVVARREVGQPAVADPDHPAVDLVDDRVGHRVRPLELRQVGAGLEPTLDPTFAHSCRFLLEGRLTADMAAVSSERGNCLSRMWYIREPL